MFLTSTDRGYDRHGQQKAAGTFLLLCLPDKPTEQTTFDCKTGEWHDEQCDGKITCWAGEKAPCPKCGKEWYARSWNAPWGSIRALVRHAKLRQCGHFMMGSVTLHGHKIVLSGTYGGDGLPRTVPRDVWERGVPVPEAILEVYRTGGGHNGPGKEGPLLHTWGLGNLDELRKASRNGAPPREETT